VLLLEITGPKNRVMAGNIMAYGFSIGQMIIVTFAYAMKDYRKLNWMLACFVWPLVGYYWCVQESPRWLISVDRVYDASRVIKKITTINMWYYRKLNCKFCFFLDITCLNFSEF
jgi:hypothetical protein